MNKNERSEVLWLDDAEAHNYPAAVSYLSLVYEPREAAQLVERLRKTEETRFKAKDIFRASGLSLLGVSNLHVEKNRKKIREHVALSPILLVRDTRHGRVVIADGYHRLCAVYGVDEDAWVHCRIV